MGDIQAQLQDAKSQYEKASDKTEAEKLFRHAQQKFEEALSASVSSPSSSSSSSSSSPPSSSSSSSSSSPQKHEVLCGWGELYLIKGMREKKAGQKEVADDSLTEARGKLEQALEVKPDYELALSKLAQALHEQSDLKEGHQKFWFVSQAAEKNKQVENLRAGVPNSASPSIPPDQKLLRAIEFKDKGNLHFKSGALPKAMLNWHSALNFVNGAYGFSTKQEQQAKDIKLALYNNMATVHIKQGKIGKAIEELNQVLTIDPQNVKGLFRRGRAHLANNDIEKARTDLLKAREVAPEDKDVKNELLLLERKEKLQDTKQKNFYAKMF